MDGKPEQVVTPNDFSGSDSERINQAVADGARSGVGVVIPRVNETGSGPRDLWLLESAILVPGSTSLELRDCHLKLSDRCRDNFIRSANCGIGITDVQTISDIHIRGTGRVLLEGADHPRATGDSAKTLGQRTYGTDAGVEGENQVGDWRNIGILLACVERFSLENLRIKDAHCWAVSLERCAHGRVRDIDFAATESRMIDGVEETTLNQDGLDLRQGCHDITIDGITGFSGDDLVALTAIDWNHAPAGGLSSSMVTPGNNRGEGLDDIHDITVRNVRGHSRGGHQIVRLLNSGGIGMYNILIDGLIDTSPPEIRDHAALRIGDSNPAWGGVTPLGDTSRIIINNVISRARHTILIAGSLTDSAISNVIRSEGGEDPISYASGRENTRDLLISNVQSSCAG